MNRIIKFRAWDKKRKVMVGSDYPKNWADEKDEYWGDTTRIDLTGVESLSENKRFDLMQFTGLTDKNGKEIYEGDIVKSDALLGIVEYDESDAQFKVESDYNDSPLVAHHDMDELEYEVIGNVWENPDLIK